MVEVTGFELFARVLEIAVNKGFARLMIFLEVNLEVKSFRICLRF